MDFIKIKTFYASKYIIKKVKIKLTEWEKVFANHLYDVSIIQSMLRTYNWTKKTKTKKQNEKTTGYLI